MKKSIAALVVIVTSLFSAENAGISGMIITDSTIENDGFIYPKQIYTLYIANNPADRGEVLVYLSYKKIGKHESLIELTDNKTGKYIDKCTFEASEVTKLPWVQTVSCSYSGRQADTGIVFSIYDKFAGKQEKIGEMYLPAKKKNIFFYDRALQVSKGINSPLVSEIQYS